jgi:hypothetical protein
MNMKGNERVLDFKVYLPQLEVDPGRFKGGVKRYPLRKNEDSAALVIGGSFVPARSVDLGSKPPSLDSFASRRRDVQSLSPVQRPDYSRFVSPVKPPSEYVDFLSHPAFRQPKYTKHNPKAQPSNPILGYAQWSPSREKHTSLVENGLRILITDKSFAKNV